MDKTSEVLVKDYQRRLSDCYKYRKHHPKWEDKQEQQKEASQSYKINSL